MSAQTDSTIRVQVVPPPDRVGQLGPSKAWENLTDRVDELGDSIGVVAARLRARLDSALHDDPDVDWRLDQVTVTFSLDLEAEAGVVVARAKTTAGFEVALSWSRSP